MVFGIVRRTALIALWTSALVTLAAAGDPCPCLTEMDRQTILAHYGGGLPGLPLSEAKKIEHPGEFHKVLKKNAALPAALQAKIQPLPPVLEAQLSPTPKGHKRVAADRYVLVIAEAGNVVTDFVDYTKRIGIRPWATSMWR